MNFCCSWEILNPHLRDGALRLGGVGNRLADGALETRAFALHGEHPLRRHQLFRQELAQGDKLLVDVFDLLFLGVLLDLNTFDLGLQLPGLGFDDFNLAIQGRAAFVELPDFIRHQFRNQRIFLP